MDDKLDSSKVSPPQSIIIQAANPDNVNDVSSFTTFPGAQRKRNKSGFKKANRVIDKSKKKNQVIDKSKKKNQVIDKRKKKKQVIDKRKKKKQVIDKRKKKKQVIDKRKKKKQVTISVDEGPSGELLVSSLLMIIISTVGPFWYSSELGGILGPFLVCNGNAFGFILLGVYSAQYGKWKKSSEANTSALFSNLISAVAFIVAVIFVILWLMFVTY
jgi:hypothetical protein